LNFQILSSKDINVILPQIPDTFGGLEVIKRFKIDTIIKENNLKIYNQAFAITSFDSGSYGIPSFTFLYEEKGSDAPFSTFSDSITLNFSTFPVDTSSAFKDIKPPLGVGFDWDEILKWVGVLLIIGLIVSGIYIAFWMKKKKQSEDKEDNYTPKIPPYIIAIESLKSLDAKKLWQNGKVKLYHIELTNIIRTYIERQFKINALEMTSDDLIAATKPLFKEEQHSEIKSILYYADLAKFAKSEPLPNENSLCMNYAFHFVEATKDYFKPSEDNL